jgi:hypothetical protein
MKIRDLTDYDMYIMDVTNKQSMMTKVDILWQNYKTSNCLERPESGTDQRLYSIALKLADKQAKFADECKKTPIKMHKSYIPPSKRLAVAAEDPKLVPLRKEIEFLENEFEELNKKAAQEDVDWEQSAKYEFAIQNEMFEM